MELVMRKFFLVLVALFAMNVSANQTSICETVYSESIAIMTLRQDNYSLVKLLEAYPDSKPARALIISAYEQPVFNTEQFQQRAINKFANKAMLACIKNPGVWFK